LQVSYALVVSPAASGALIDAASPGAPDAGMRAWLPVTAAAPVTADEVWLDPDAAGPDCELLATPFRTDSVILLGRMGGPSFLPAEVTRVSHLARLAQVLVVEGGTP
jgi:hypothetical protein